MDNLKALSIFTSAALARIQQNHNSSKRSTFAAGAQIEPAGSRLPFKTVLARYNPDGSPDAAFGVEGTVAVVGIGGVTTLACSRTAKSSR